MNEHTAAVDDRPLLLSEYDYELPPELIAQTPADRRDGSRLMVVDRRDGTFEHHIFPDIVTFLRPGDLLVINDTRVLPARFHGRKPTGGNVELLLLRRLEAGVWEAMGKPGRHLRPGSMVHLLTREGDPRDVVVAIERRLDGGLFAVRLPAEVEERLDRFGEMPLPPYIHARLEDPERYQTVYSEKPGSAAAPTAGLHFTPKLLATLEKRGVRVARVTLHVGLGTFLPVKVDDMRRHEMHAEWFHVPTGTRAAIQETKARGGRVIAVGTTSCRTLESVAGCEDEGDLSGWTSLFITPGYRWKTVDALITNFHLPRSTLLLLVSAFAGRELMLNAYQEAIRQGYRFYSFGDAMLIV